jgi:sigma-B regulation protein RsbU (phosphoserine phosphatase)
MPRGLVVGALPGFTFGSSRVRLAPGETLVLFSDGVTETRDPKGELFGPARLVETLARQANASALERVEAIRDAVRSFSRKGAPADDLTLLIVGRPHT